MYVCEDLILPWLLDGFVGASVAACGVIEASRAVGTVVVAAVATTVLAAALLLGLVGSTDHRGAGADSLTLQASVKARLDLVAIGRALEDRAELLRHEEHVLVCCQSDRALDEVVSEAVLEHPVQDLVTAAVDADKDLVLNGLVEVEQCLLHDVGSELVAAQLNGMGQEGFAEVHGVGALVADLKEMLNDVVGEGIHGEAGEVLVDGIEEFVADMAGGGVHGALHHDAPLLSGGNLDAVGGEEAEDEGAVHGVQEELDDAAGVQTVGAHGED